MNKKVVGSIFVLMLVLSITVSAAGVAIKRVDTNNNDTLVLVRIAVGDEPVNLPRDMEIVGSSVGEWIEIIIPEQRLQELSVQQINYEVIIWDVEEYEQSIRGTYHTLAQM